MKKVVSIILLICILFTALFTSASAEVISEISQTYLKKQELSVWEALGLSLNGYEVPQDFYDSLAKDIEQKNGVYRNVTDYAKIVIFLKQEGKDPKSFKGYDLISSITAFKQIDKSGINGILFSLLALTGIETDKNALWNITKLCDLLLEYQNLDGGFPLVKGWGSDNDLTAISITALSQHYSLPKIKVAVDAALVYLSQKLDKEGLMLYQNSDSSENLSQVIIALKAMGISLTDERFVRNGKTVYDTLIEKYMTSDKRFKHNLAGGANDIATEQAYLALSAMGVGYAYAKPVEKLPEPSITPTPKPTATPTADVSASPVPTKLPFSDQDKISLTLYTSIQKAYETSLIVGDGNNYIRPEEYLTRAEASVLLYKAAGLKMNIFIPRFLDIKQGNWYTKSVVACYLNGILMPTDYENFEPGAFISEREFTNGVRLALGVNVSSLGSNHVTREDAISMVVEYLYKGVK